MKAILSEPLKTKLQWSLSKLPRAAGRHPRVVVLCYHSTHPSGDFPSTTPAELFDQHMRWLRQHCDLVPFTSVRAEARRPDWVRTRVAVTFDDGFADNYTYALPILLRYEVPATFFVATGLVGRSPDVIKARSWRGWRDQASTLRWTQIVEMQRLGMEIGSHGHSHRVLAQLDDQAVTSDLSMSKQILEGHLGERVVSFAYPKGRPRRDFSPKTIPLAQRVGYEFAAAVLLRGVRSSDVPMSIPRFPVARDSLDMLRAKVEGKLDALGSLQERAPVWILRAIGR
jgi:peptidoglycan/xylan/chitin deacetylase (PgdA/CDA1 family)